MADKIQDKSTDRAHNLQLALAKIEKVSERERLCVLAKRRFPKWKQFRRDV